MKILQINTVGKSGSIATIMHSLSREMEKHSITNCIAYGRNGSPHGISSHKFGNSPDFYFHVLGNFIYGKAGFYSDYTTKQFIKWIKEYQPDLIHMHNLHGFYLNIELLFEYLKTTNIPIVWTLHDCWSFTGHCAYFDSISCSKWKSGCKNCRIHRTTYPYALLFDASKSNYARKKEAFCNVPNLTLVTPSNWLKDNVLHSFLKDYPVHVIANGIDPTLFFKEDEKKSLQKLQKIYAIHPHKKILLGVCNVWDKRKGLLYFEAIADTYREEFQVILIGLNARQIKYFKKKYDTDTVLPLGRTKTRDELRHFFNIASLFVNPTLEDNFPTTNLESLACGTPVVTFQSGGSGEAISSNCGAVVGQGDIAELFLAIDQLDSYSSEECQAHFLEHYTESCFSSQYLSLYYSLIKP
ncbi:MAG: glycosyltransferase [Lachnospiraceae bacterium]